MRAIFSNVVNNANELKNIILQPFRADPNQDMGAWIKTFHPDVYMRWFPFGVIRPYAGSIKDFRRYADNSSTIMMAINKRVGVVSSADFKIISESKNKETEKKIKKDIQYPRFGDTWQIKMNKLMDDVLKISDGYFIKSFNNKGEMVRFDAVDGASILINPDWHGNIDYRADYIDTSDTLKLMERGLFYFQKYGNEITRQNIGNLYGEYFDGMSAVPAYYQYGAGMVRVPVPLGKREVARFQQNARSYDVYGFPYMQTLWNVMKTILFSEIKDMEFMVNNGIPPGILTMLNAETDDLKVLKEHLTKLLVHKDPSGDNRRHWWEGVPMMNQEMKYVPLPIPSKDMQELETLGVYRKLIWAIWGVPPTLLGMGEHPTFRNMGTEKQNFIENTAKTDFQMIEAVMNNQILPEYEIIYGLSEDDLSFEFVYADLETQIKKAKLRQIELNIKQTSVNELRVEDRKKPWPGEKYNLPVEGGFGGVLGEEEDERERGIRPSHRYGRREKIEGGGYRYSYDDSEDEEEIKSKPGFFPAEELSDEEVLKLLNRPQSDREWNDIYGL